MGWKANEPPAALNRVVRGYLLAHMDVGQAGKQATMRWRGCGLCTTNAGI
jgi:hypothetical protein